MLEDRNYMRRTPFESGRSATLTLVLVNAAVFLVQQIAYRFFPEFPTDGYFALSLAGLRHGFVWQLLTYEFMHGGLLHLLFNCWAIYVFGLEVETALGRRSFLTLYFASGIIGGLVQALAGALVGYPFSGPVVGASAAAFGLAAAFAVLFPDRILLLFFIIPMRAKYLLLLGGGLTLYGLLRPGAGSNVAHAAHLGGLLTGLVFVRYGLHWNWQWPRWKRARGKSSRRLIKVVPGGGSLWGQHASSEESLPPEEFLSKEVDPILDKISAHGIQSLTARERRILEAAREKMAKR